MPDLAEKRLRAKTTLNKHNTAGSFAKAPATVNDPKNWHTSLENFGIHYSPDYTLHAHSVHGLRPVAQVNRFDAGAGKFVPSESRLTLLQMKQFEHLVSSAGPDGLQPVIEQDDLPISELAYTSQSHVDLDHAKRLASIPASELPPVWVQRQPDGRASIIEGHHRVVAAILRGDKTIRAVVYGGWEPRKQPVDLSNVDTKRLRAKTTLNKHNTAGSFADTPPDPSIDLDKPISWTAPKGGGTIPAGTRAAIRERMKRHPVDAQNIVDMYENQSTQEERDLGKDWYPNASRVVEALAAKHGVTRATVAGLIANYSPQKPWGQNLIEAAEALRHMRGVGGKGNKDNPLSGKGIMATDAQRGNAGEVLGRRLGIEINADDVFAPKYGAKGTAGAKSAGQALKIRNFFKLVYRGEDPEAVVVDRHAYGVARGIAMTEAEYSLMTPSSDSLYNEAAQAYREAAQRLSMKYDRHVTPGEVQAATWLTRQRLNKGTSSARETLGKQDWLNLKAYVKRYLPEMQSVFFEGGATTGYNLAFAMAEDIDLANDHWKFQPRDPGGEGGGRWVKAIWEELSPHIPQHQGSDVAKGILEDAAERAVELNSHDEVLNPDVPSAMKALVNDEVSAAMIRRAAAGRNSSEVTSVAPLFEYALREHDNYDSGDAHLAIRAGVRDAIDTWATTSLDHHVKALYLQRAVAERFGLHEQFEQALAYALDPEKPGAHYQDVAAVETGMANWDEHRDWYHAIVESMYEVTQADLAARGITHLRLHRGMNLRQADLGDADSDGVWEFDFNPVASWSASDGTARGFAAGTGETLFEIVVPAESVFSGAAYGLGCFEEEEFVLLGGKHEVSLKRRAWVDQMLGDLVKRLSPASGEFFDNFKAWAKTTTPEGREEAIPIAINVGNALASLWSKVSIASEQGVTETALKNIKARLITLRNARDDLRAARARHVKSIWDVSGPEETLRHSNERAAFEVAAHQIGSTLKAVEDWLREAEAKLEKQQAKKQQALLAKYDTKPGAA